MGVPNAGWVVHAEINLSEKIMFVPDLIDENHLQAPSSVKEFQYWDLRFKSSVLIKALQPP